MNQYSILFLYLHSHVWTLINSKVIVELSDHSESEVTGEDKPPRQFAKAYAKAMPGSSSLSSSENITFSTPLIQVDAPMGPAEEEPPLEEATPVVVFGAGILAEMAAGGPLATDLIGYPDEVDVPMLPATSMQQVIEDAMGAAMEGTPMEEDPPSVTSAASSGGTVLGL